MESFELSLLCWWKGAGTCYEQDITAADRYGVTCTAADTHMDRQVNSVGTVRQIRERRDGQTDNPG